MKAPPLQTPPLRRVPRSSAPPLSFAQQRLWFIDQLEPNSSLYNMPVAFRLEGELNVAALERGFGELIRRHEALRTTFGTEHGSPVQRILPELPFHLETMELDRLPEAARVPEARRRVEEAAQRPFDLAMGPLLRALLVRLGPRQHVLLVTMHHIVSDGWSLGVFVREMVALYGAFSAGRPSPLPELPVQYADYAIWQREWLQGEVLEAQLQYWRGQLAGSSPLDLPTDRPRPAVPSFRGVSLPLRLPRQLSEALQALGRKEGATPFMVLLAAFQVLLHRYSGQDDLSVGTPIAGRSRVELEGLIGFFINTLVLRTRLSGELTFRELLAQVSQTTLGAYAHQEVPFEKLVEVLQPDRTMARAPLFQVMFVLQNAPTSELTVPGLTFRSLELESSAARFELTLSLTETASGVVGALEYSTELFDPATAERMVASLKVLLEGIAADPERRLSELPLLKAPERRRLLVDWNATGVSFPPADSVHSLFEAQVDRTPEAVAVSFEGRQLRYGELDARANRLARFLREKGVGPEAVVALCVERSPELVVGLLGVLKAGGAYLPLDPAYPRERLAFMLEDSGAKVLLTQERLAALLPPGGVERVFLDSGGEELAGLDGGRLASGATADNLAYVIYTSGSTGRPKGTLLAHRGLCNTARAAIEAMGLRAESRVLQFAASGFDASVWEIFPALLAGARLSLAPKEALLPGEPLRTVLRDQGITAVTLMPSVLARLEPEGLPTLETVVSAGEACPPEVARRWKTGRRFINAYGPTEATVCATLDSEVDPERPGIGRPLPNVRRYVLDGRREPVPVGVPGELYLGGVGLARGYLGLPALTAERFIPDPFGTEPGARLYRTGDRVRYRPDGRLEFLGRLDEQVKVRGYRIELGEIEAALAAHPAVREAVVVAREDVPGDKRLVAYVVARGEAPGTAILRGLLQQRLPEYMVPSTFVALEALPLAPGGKVDRKSLPAPDGARPELAQRFVAPRTPTEARLAELWAGLLNVKGLGVHDGFFELGGHSLLATQALSRIRESFGVELPLRDVFTAPTVAGLAERIDAILRAGQPLRTPPLLPAPRTGALPLSFAQQRLWFIDQLEPNSPVYNMAAALRLDGALDVAALERSFGELIRRHEALRTTFPDEQGRPTQVISPALPFHLETVELSGLPEAAVQREAQRRADEEGLRPFELARGPLLRALLLRLGEREHVLLVTMHHIVSDGWSMGILVRELVALYGAFSMGSPSPLPELPVQYGDYAIWQREWLQGEVLDAQLAYWRRQLEGAPPLELPADRPRPAVPGFRGATLPVRLPEELSVEFDALARREGATPFMVLLAAFQVLLHRYSGQDDVSVGSPIAGRNRVELEGLIGFFVNTLVLRSRFAAELSFRELLARVKETTLEAYAHQDLPFDRLVEALQPERDLGRTPLFQVMFVLQNAPVGELALPGLTFRQVEQEARTARFELTLSLSETAGGLAGMLEYSTELLEAQTARRMVAHLQRLLEEAVAHPDERLWALDMLPEEERAKLLVSWNETAAAPPAELLVHRLVEAQVERTPEAVAVLFEGVSLTYRQLNARANRLAWHLRALGIGVESTVALFAEPSLDAVVALLGILKAGAAYVPVDPGYPAERLDFMLRDAGASVVVTQSRLASSLPQVGARLVFLDEAEALALLPVDNPGFPQSGEALAYVIYTSGSTGRPKGVAMPHRALAHMLAWQLQRSPHPRAATLQFASLSFDVSFQECFSTWAAGGTLVLPPPGLRQDPVALLRFLGAYRVERLFLPFVALQQLADTAQAEPHLPGALREVVTAGEQLQVTPAIVSFFERLPGCVLENQYGPSESHVASAFLLSGPPRDWRRLPPIGRPISNTRLYVLDAHLRPTPIGVPGELFIGGPHVARGYLARPELTAERFMPDPFAGTVGERLYRTGDLARFLADGNLEFVGRLDGQVKVRGYRIELGEVEAALRAHPLVRDAAAAVRQDAAGGKRLVGYVIPQGATAPEPGALREFLARHLPEYMVPSAFKVLEALPLTPSGKLDRRALPAPDAPRAVGFVAPRTPLEQTLASLFASVLGVARVGLEDDFFALGGHSLLAAHLMARIPESTGKSLPLSALFQGATVEHLASLLRQTRDTEPWSPLVRISGGGTRRPFFCAHPVGGNVLCYAELARQLGPEQPFYGLQARGLEEGQEPCGSLEEMAALYLEAIRSVQPEGPYLLGGWSLGGTVAFEMARQLEAQGQRVALVALIDSYARVAAPELLGGELAAQMTALFIRDLLGTSAEGISIPEEVLGRGDPEELLRYVLEQGGAVGAVLPDAERLRSLRRVFESNLRAGSGYVPKPYGGRVTLLQASESPVELEEQKRGWEPVAGRLEVHEVPGDHYSILRDPNVQALAGLLKQSLERAQAVEPENGEKPVL